MDTALMDEIAAVSGRLEKERLIARMDEGTRRFVAIALDPNITFGVTVDEVVPALSSWTSKEFWDAILATSNELAARKLTGNAARNAVDTILSRAPSPRDLEWAKRFLNKNLRAGFDIKTFNKMFSGSVRKFAVQLAEAYTGEQETLGQWHVQPKLDGNRVVLIDGRAMSRNGKEYPNCRHVIDELVSKDPSFFEKWVLDGEMMGDLGFDKSSGALRRLNDDGKKRATFTYWVFDIIDRQEWERMSTRPLIERVSDLSNVIGPMELSSVKAVPTRSITDPTHGQIMAICDEFLATGFEGAMIKDVKSPYVFGRGRNLMKVKKFHDIDVRVHDMYEGKGKHKGRLGGLIASGDGVDVRVGSGFDDALREAIWADKNGWIGAVIEVQYQDKTADGSLRFPVFIRRRLDKE